MRFDASPSPEKGVCHLKGLAKTSVTVDALPLGQIWFQSVMRVRRTGLLTDRAAGKHLPSSPKRLDDWTTLKDADQWHSHCLVWCRFVCTICVIEIGVDRLIVVLTLFGPGGGVDSTHSKLKLL